MSTVQNKSRTRGAILGESPILYFDRCIGKEIPEALRRLGMKNVYHHHIHRAIVGDKPTREQQSLFVHNTEDDEWMDYVGSRGWVVISQDYRLQLQPSTLTAIKQHRVRVFYLWGAEAVRIDTMRTFLNARRRIEDMATRNPGPYIFRVSRGGALTKYM